MPRPNQIILAAAIRTTDGRLWTLPIPARHGDILRHIYETTHDEILHMGSHQGFIDDQHRFLTREEAMRIARLNGQLKRDLNNKTTYQGPKLFTEDLW